MDVLHLNLPVENKEGAIGSHPVESLQSTKGLIPEESLSSYVQANTNLWLQANHDLVTANAYGYRR